jgi:hypothetical protein
MSSHSLTDEPEASGAGAPAPQDADSDAAIVPYVWRRIAGRFPPGDAEIAATLAKNPLLPHSVAEYLYNRIVTSKKGDVRAAKLLVQGQSRTAINYAFLAWRELAGSGQMRAVRKVLTRFLARPEPSAAVAEGVRESLADGNAQVRLAALDILARIGALEDIGLLSDLLALPLASDEHPAERAALVRSMRAIAETGR